MKLTVEAVLAAEMENHLCYPPHSAAVHHSGNSRNGTTPKILKGASVRGFDRGTPRDRLGSFEPEIVRKGQTCITGMDEQILCLFAIGLSTRDIVEVFAEIYGAEVSAGLLSQVTNAIESLNSVIRKATKKRKVFPNDDAALKVVFLATQAASKKWTSADSETGSGR